MATEPDYKLKKREGVVIVGSGPIGATYARKLLDAGIKVLMIEMGEQATRKVGDHKKNSVAVQKDISLFTGAIQGELALLSVPVDTASKATLDPECWGADGPALFVHNNQNPEQKAFDNLTASAVTRQVGGMGSHWTCCTPRQYEGIERSTIYPKEQWEQLYKEAEGLFHTTDKAFDDSIRQVLVKDTLIKANPNRKFESMPLACERSTGKNKEYIEWTATAHILGEQYADPKYNGGQFELWTQTRCTKVKINEVTRKVDGLCLKNLLTEEYTLVTADRYIICAGAVLSAGILHNSGINPETGYGALGHFMTEQTMTFCQVVLKKSLVETVWNTTDEVWRKKVDEHHKKFPQDPLPFPFDDPDPQVYTPFSEGHPWHTQIHRDAFGYGAVPANVDQRLIVDLRFFGYVKPTYKNCVEFSNTMTDAFGMPQPTFHYKLSKDDSERAHRMMKDMNDLAQDLGGFLPGAEPKFLAPGSALHVCGTTRAGKVNDGTSVVDEWSRVWHLEELYVGGCGVIPTQNACNPTLTAACFAIVGANKIIEELGSRVTHGGKLERPSAGERIDSFQP